MTASITLGLDEYDKLRDDAKAAQARITELEAALTAAKLAAAPDDRKIAAYDEALRHALTIASYAVAQIPFEQARSFPTKQLLALVEAAPALLVNYTQNDRERASAFLDYTAEVERFERWRLAQPKNAPSESEATRLRLAGKQEPSKMLTDANGKTVDELKVNYLVRIHSDTSELASVNGKIGRIREVLRPSVFSVRVDSLSYTLRADELELIIAQD